MIRQNTIGQTAEGIGIKKGGSDKTELLWCEDPIILTASRYSAQLAAYHEEFGPESVLVLIAEELHRDCSGTMSRVAEYLGLMPHAKWSKPPPRINAIGETEFLRRLSTLPGQRLLQAMRRTMPMSLKNRIRAIASVEPRLPPIRPEDEDEILDLVAADLQELRATLGSRIDIWPSARKLRLSQV